MSNEKNRQPKPGTAHSMGHHGGYSVLTESAVLCDGG